jgi:hypothetical protein
MRFVLEVDLPEEPGGGTAADELSRILRYWAGGVRQMELVPGAGTDVYDSTYTKVGAWRITGEGPAAAG